MIFTLARGGAGTPAFLVEAGQRYGFAVEIVERIAADSERLDRASLLDRDAQGARELAMSSARRALLGHPYFVIAEVVHGEKRGRDLGFPTANLRLHHSVRLRHGIYAVRVRIDESLVSAASRASARVRHSTMARRCSKSIFSISPAIFTAR